jgi:hypothetical protein
VSVGLFGIRRRKPHKPVAVAIPTRVQFLTSSKLIAAQEAERAKLPENSVKAVRVAREPV